uniref:Uncharacterized protein n=1 Tax=Globisporangium ultimum (strain ATCC 200006 / CBS 805.95 / DAOM BR144) TaxID=431595 RepID=K3WSQ7_GLOUD
MALRPAPSMEGSAALQTTRLTKAHAATIIALLLLLFMDLGGAVNVGDAEVHRDLISAASGSGAGAENANDTCPNVTTVLVYSTVSSTTATSVQIVDAACERVVVTATTTTSSEVLLDLQDRGIVEIKSLPPNTARQ